MSLNRLTVIAFAFVLTTTSLAAQEPESPDPLFQSDDILDVRISAPIYTLIKERPIEEELPGKFQFTSDADETIEIDLLVRARGHFRRKKETCLLPPLRLNFKTSQTKDTLFHKQDKVKLVTHCRPSSKYEQTVLREYLVYKMLNALTDNSYRVRLLRITYVDTDNKRKEQTRLGFIIEHRERLSKRINRPRVETRGAKIDELDPAYTNLASVFHFMIGNTDYSPVLGPVDEVCCHNAVLFGSENELFWPIPYDFDHGGMVDAPYASPNPRFKLRNIRQRLYRGRCQFNAQLPSTYATFIDKRDAIVAEIENAELLEKRPKRFMLGYVESFYDTIETENRAEKQITKKCI